MWEAVEAGVPSLQLIVHSFYFRVYFSPTGDISSSPMGFDTTARSKRLTFHPTGFNGGDRRKTTGVDVLVPLRPSSSSPWDLSIQILATALCSGGCHPVHLFLGFKEPCLSSAPAFAKVCREIRRKPVLRKGVLYAAFLSRCHTTFPQACRNLLNWFNTTSPKK